MLFHSYELYNNSLFFYEEMFKDLKNLYHNDNRVNFLESFYREIADNVGRPLKISDLKIIFDAANHPLCINEQATEEEVRYDFFDTVDSFQFIKVIFIFI